MTDVSETPQDEQKQQVSRQTADSPAAAQNTDHMIPKSRFDEVNERAKTLAAELETLKTERQKAEQQTLEEQQRYKELYEKTQSELEALKVVQEQAERYQQSLQATNDARIAQIPEERRHLVPEYDDPVKLSAWLDKALDDLLETPKPRAPKLDGGSGSGGESIAALSATHEQLADIAAQYGYKVDKERIAKFANQSSTNRTGDES